jgi:hypothetical protein
VSLTTLYGYAVAQPVKALYYKPEGRGFDYRWYLNPSARTMAMESTYPLTEMSTRNISWKKKAASADNITITALKFGIFNLMEPSRHIQGCNGIALLLRNL